MKGIVKPPPFYPLLGAVTLPKGIFDTLFEQQRNRFVFVSVAGEPTEASKRAIEQAVADYPDARVQTRQEWVDKEDAEFQQFLAMLYVLLALSVIVSIFGIINTLVLSVFERTRELGMLRAVGMTRRQTRRMIRHESIITALIGAALGLPLGHLPRAPADPRARPVRRAVQGADGSAHHLRDRRDRRRRARGDPPGPPRRAAERAARPPVRVTRV